MPSAFRQIADELNPNYVPEWAVSHRRPVPGYATRLLATFGTYWLPRIGLTAMAAGTFAMVAAFVAAAARSWVIAVALIVVSISLVVAGSVMWQSYRMRHWLPDGAGSSAPMTAAVRVPARKRIWMSLGLIDALAGTALFIWVVTSSPGVRAMVFGAGIYALCTGTACAVLIRQLDAISGQKVRFMGMTGRRAAVVILLVGLGFAVTSFLQLPFFQGSLLPAH
jgi:hypothetical protein